MVCRGTEDVFSPAMISGKCVLTTGVLKSRCVVYTLQNTTKHHLDVLRFLLLAFVDMGIQQLPLEVQLRRLKNKLESCHSHIFVPTCCSSWIISGSGSAKLSSLVYWHGIAHNCGVQGRAAILIWCELSRLQLKWPLGMHEDDWLNSIQTSCSYLDIKHNFV